MQRPRRNGQKEVLYPNPNIVFAWLPLSNEDRSPDSKYVLTKHSLHVMMLNCSSKHWRREFQEMHPIRN